jgi:hypothetical protein
MAELDTMTMPPAPVPAETDDQRRMRLAGAQRPDLMNASSGACSDRSEAMTFIKGVRVNPATEFKPGQR